MNYYKVVAKCGHVGRGHYILKDFFIEAEDGKEAAYMVRFRPRVKHHWKDAIVTVTLISKEEFIRGRELQKNDLYFNVTNSTEQRLSGAVDYEQVFEFEKPERKKKDKSSIFYNKVLRIQQKDLRTRLAEVI